MFTPDVCNGTFNCHLYCHIYHFILYYLGVHQKKNILSQFFFHDLLDEVKYFCYHMMQYDVPNFSERTEPSQVVSDRLKITYESERCGQDRPKNLSDDSQLSRIEQLITGKQFSRYVVISNIFSPNSLLVLSSYCLYYQILTVVLLWFFYFK